MLMEDSFEDEVPSSGERLKAVDFELSPPLGGKLDEGQRTFKHLIPRAVQESIARKTSFRASSPAYSVDSSADTGSEV